MLLLCCSLNFSLSLSMNICLVFFQIAYRVKFGRPTAAMNAIEPQGHKTLHGHLASILQCGDDFDALKTLVSRIIILDITFTASLPTKSYAAVVTKHLLPHNTEISQYLYK